MDRLLLGVLLGITFGLIDVAMTVFGDQPNHTSSLLWPAFFSRFAIGFLVANVNHQVAAKGVRRHYWGVAKS